MVEEETLEEGPKSGEKEELGEEEWVSLNTLSLRKTKIWQDYSTSLELKRGEERGVFSCLGIKERRGLYSSDGENMNGRPFNEGWQRIMNLVLILALGEIWCIKWKDWWEWGASQIRFSATAVTACRANFKKSYLTQFWSELSHSCAQIEAPDV